MANKEHLAILEKGVTAWNRWRATSSELPDLSDANLEGIDLEGANLSNANLRQATLRAAKLLGADLTSADLGADDMRSTDLSDAQLAGASFRCANLGAATFNHSNLQSADLAFADLTNCDFTHANLSDADLSGADLEDANLSFANLRGALLGYVDFTESTLSNADLTSAVIACCRFDDCDLSAVTGLETAKHFAPSTIGLDTIYQSKGNIPESFLRGCGVPESFITQMHSLVGAEGGIQFYSCFISYSGEDHDFANRLHGRMRDAHLRVWFAPEHVQGGKKLHEQIETAIRFYDKLLVVLSEASLQSEWVMDELRKGFKAERDTGKRKLFPVRLTDYETLDRWECRDSLSGKDLAEEVRQYFIPDFSNWKDHDAFETAFSRLLKDLRSDERTK